MIRTLKKREGYTALWLCCRHWPNAFCIFLNPIPILLRDYDVVLQSVGPAHLQMDAHGQQRHTGGSAMAVREVTEEMIQSVRDRRTFLTGLGMAGVGLAAAGIAGCGGSSTTTTVQAASSTDTATQIFTAALIAEDLAITAYYNALTGGAIQDPNLAGPGGTATNVSSSGSQVNVAYLQAALSEELQHAVLLRTLLGLNTDGSADTGAGVPATFYFPTGTFDTLENFLPIQLALETAFIGAYMLAVEELPRWRPAITASARPKQTPP